MQKTERLFHLVERLRSSPRPLIAKTIAQELEVSERTIYRDMKLLIAQGLPISGEAGVGYVIASNFNAPALQFTHDELEILSIGLRIVFRDGDAPMRKATETAFSKIRNGLKGTSDLDAIDLYAPSGWSEQKNNYLSELRHIIRNRSIIKIEYLSLNDKSSARIIKPLALLFFQETTLVAGYCELRKDFRSFRVDRIKSITETGTDFKAEHYKLRRAYFETVKKQTI